MGKNLARGPRKKSLDFGGKPDHVTLVLRLGREVVRWTGGVAILRSG